MNCSMACSGQPKSCITDGAATDPHLWSDLHRRRHSVLAHRQCRGGGAELLAPIHVGTASTTARIVIAAETGGDVAATTARLQGHVSQAVADYDNGVISMSARQARAAARNPALEPTFRGQVIDKAAKNAVRNGPNLSHLWVVAVRRVRAGLRHRHGYLVGRDHSGPVVEPRGRLQRPVRHRDRLVHGMSVKQLQGRWKSGDGRPLAGEVLEFLLGERRQLPDGVGTHGGRADLRGLNLPAPARGTGVAAGGVSAQTTSGVLEFRGVRWQGLDLSQARLPSRRFFGAAIDDCRFDGALRPDWRLWGSEVKDCSFARLSTLGPSTCICFKGSAI